MIGRLGALRRAGVSTEIRLAVLLRVANDQWMQLAWRSRQVGVTRLAWAGVWRHGRQNFLLEGLMAFVEEWDLRQKRKDAILWNKHLIHCYRLISTWHEDCFWGKTWVM